MNEFLRMVAHDPKATIGVAGGTTAAGTAQFLNLIPDDIGKLASVVGIVLSLVLIVANVIKIRQDLQKGRLEMEALRAQIKRSGDEQ